jgi:hypothetical protein
MKGIPSFRHGPIKSIKQTFHRPLSSFITSHLKGDVVCGFCVIMGQVCRLIEENAASSFPYGLEGPPNQQLIFAEFWRANCSLGEKTAEITLQGQWLVTKPDLVFATALLVSTTVPIKSL